ncbi:cytochrome C oxidase subunit IV family protein [Algisphaera agarilytica]|uniref:Cytochrome c oxidase subunit 4 n=1 Tax=Algisphaera agarilytica TaxID=1385975 RepID=A0A7X0H578_9BACT|nr:cytochrome C oxidase subunit IV family protein [Algisphaera agarilytica]MBB6429455.1 cytochrome c oxidase subunit 4 [Algisphaera agarilytica]
MSDTTAHDAEHHDDHGDHGHHVVPLSLLFGVFLILMFLTVITVAVTKFDFGYELNLVVAMAIALVKAVFVGLYFMHLRWDAPLNGFILVTSLLFVTLFIAFTLIDTGQYATFQEAAAIRGSAP